MTPSDLVTGVAPVSGLVGSPEMDPITEKGALQEAQLVEVLYNAVRCRIGLLFDLRIALQLRMHNTGLLIFDGVASFSWVSNSSGHAKIAWNVMDSVPDNRDGLVMHTLFMLPDAELHVSARSAVFFAGDVPNLGDRAPNYLKDTDEVVAAGTQSMRSPFKPSQRSMLEPSSRHGL